MSGSQLGEVMYGLFTVIHSQRIAPNIWMMISWIDRVYLDRLLTESINRLIIF